jgi:hydrogenase expression/formation protein HypE
MKELGKIQHGFFENTILQNCGYKRNEVSCGPGFGVDVAVIDLPNGLAMATASDPLSLIPSLGLEESAWLSVYLMANDIATTGHSAMYAQFVLNLPAHFSATDFKIYWNYIHMFCKEQQIAITGGHTGFIEGQNSTIAGGGTLTTIAPKEDILVSKHAESDNVLLVTKQCAISSSAILAMSFPETVKSRLGKEIYDQGCELFYKTSSVNDALVAVGLDITNSGITAMHDVTEGGVLGAIYELAIASGNGARIYNDYLPMGEAQKQICNLFSIDPRYCVGAGSMIIAVKRSFEKQVISRLKQQNIACAIVGELTEKEKGIKLIEDNKERDLLYSGKDPYWGAFFKAYQEGWK